MTQPNTQAPAYDLDDEDPIPPKVKDAPESIWLNYGDIERDSTHTEVCAAGDVSWCEDKVFASDVRYVREDLAALASQPAHAGAVDPGHLFDLRYVLNVLHEVRAMVSDKDGAHAEIGAAITGLRYVIDRTERAAPPQAQPAPVSCNNDECGWAGSVSEACMLGSIGPLCPNCRETIEPAPVAVDELSALVAAVDAEMAESWECNSYHPSLRPALEAARKVALSASSGQDCGDAGGERPQNCGTGHCSCIECPYGEQPAALAANKEQR